MKPTLSILNTKLDKILKLLENPVITTGTTTYNPVEKWNILKMKSEHTAEYLFKECKKLFDCYSWIDLSKVKSDRNGDYTIEYKPNIEADEEWKNISANDLPKNRKFITLEERLQLEIQCFRATGKHLDIDNWTLCAGSRGINGHVPYVDWSGSKLRVSYCHPDNAGVYFRARPAV